MRNRGLVSFFQLFLVALGLGIGIGIAGAFPQSEVYALKAFKEAIFEDPSLVLSNWQTLDSDPCDYSGVFCSVDRDHVIKLNITGASLKGFLARELSLLTFLQELVLHRNSLIGIIPKELGSLKNLKVLDLGVNQLSGPIPPEIGNLGSIIKINLQSNGLTGRLPSELGSLKSLQELRLDRNKLQGSVPATNGSENADNMRGMLTKMEPTGLCRSSQLQVVDLSFNFFIGHISKCLERIPRLSFQGNCLDKDHPKQRTTSQCAKGGAQMSNALPSVSSHPVEADSKHHTSSSKPSWLLPLEIVTGVMVGTLLIGVIASAFKKWKTKPSIRNPWKRSGSDNGYSAIGIDSEVLKGVTKFNRQELEVACEDFSNIIGSSPDSLVYKGTIKGGPEIAVISLCVKEEHWTGYLELYFQTEVADLARLNHENTGKLLGYCRESSPFTRMLVFEYASNGTLYEHLHYGDGERCQLSWTRRMRIIIGIAKGLKYLHTELHPPFTISELNSSAVYLTDDFSPKLVDFESWKSILSRSEKNSGNISTEGAICVLPNAMEARHLDIQGNIYAFGILVLELVSGRPPYSEDKGYLVDWAKDYLQSPEGMPSVVDPELEHFRLEDLTVICEVVLTCIQANSHSIASMEDLCGRLVTGIDISPMADLRSSSLAWAELALSS